MEPSRPSQPSAPAHPHVDGRAGVAPPRVRPARPSRAPRAAGRPAATAPTSTAAIARGAIDPAGLRQVLGSFPVGVTIVTLFDGDRPRGITVSSFASLSLEPPLVGVAVDRSRSLYGMLRASGRFAINVLDEGGGPLSDCFAGAPVTPGRDEFCGASWHPGATGLPLLDAAIATLEVEVQEVHPVGDHDLFVGRVIAAGERPGAALPLVYLRRRYLRIEQASLEKVVGPNEGPSRRPAQRIEPGASPLGHPDRRRGPTPSAPAGSKRPPALEPRRP